MTFFSDTKMMTSQVMTIDQKWQVHPSVASKTKRLIDIIGATESRIIISSSTISPKSVKLETVS